VAEARIIDIPGAERGKRESNPGKDRQACQAASLAAQESAQAAVFVDHDKRCGEPGTHASNPVKDAAQTDFRL
jgi:hypothetical protein